MDVIYLMQETYKGMWKIFCNCLFSSIYARLGRELLFVQTPDHFLGHVLLKIFYHNNFNVTLLLTDIHSNDRCPPRITWQTTDSDYVTVLFPYAHETKQ